MDPTKPESPKQVWETRTKYAEAGKVAVIMVGLPARGKSFVARNLARYLHWIGVRTHVVSLTAIRKDIIGQKMRASFFDPSNQEALQKRTDIANKALSELIAGFQDGGQVGIYDASNTTESHRAYIQEILAQQDIKVIFLECLYSHEEDIVAAHIAELRMTCPEYEDFTDEAAIADFRQRIQYYVPDYVTMAEGNQEFSYIQIFEGSSQIVANKIFGFLPTKMLFYLMNLRHAKKTIYLLQPVAQKKSIGGLNKAMGDEKYFAWCDVGGPSALLASDLDCLNIRIRSMLSPLNPGLTEGLSEEQIRNEFPEEHARHCLDPYHHRYPRAESYHDIVIRLESTIMELERGTHSILIIADASVLRCIYAYFIEASPFLIPSLVLDPSQLIVLKPEAYGCKETRFSVETGDISQDKLFRRYTYLG